MDLLEKSNRQDRAENKKAQVRENLGFYMMRYSYVKSKIAIPGYGYWVIGRIGGIRIKGLLMKGHLFSIEQGKGKNSCFKLQMLML
ncbi:hypothetical protein ACFSC6_16835 [Rufibacter sediminis]|uniref:Uncharacterized protein n=1 Tax=Rufibacter sediminis TaxID=2762756 RepID=A0ABR6VT60_9BACT|nr:hypothetical protein [Rufibacter sediminis]MBC3540120.1 hypothetical protein [Rufibacter sediminis]